MKCPPTGSIRSWLWVCYLRDVHPTAVAKALKAVNRWDTATRAKVIDWWQRWTAAYPHWKPSARSGKKWRAEQLSRKRRGTFTASTSRSNLATRWR